MSSPLSMMSPTTSAFNIKTQVLELVAFADNDEKSEEESQQKKSADYRDGNYGALTRHDDFEVCNWDCCACGT